MSNNIATVVTVPNIELMSIPMQWLHKINLPAIFLLPSS